MTPFWQFMVAGMAFAAFSDHLHAVGAKRSAIIVCGVVGMVLVVKAWLVID